jgi:hypothetical protein
MITVRTFFVRHSNSTKLYYFISRRLSSSQTDNKELKVEPSESLPSGFITRSALIKLSEKLNSTKKVYDFKAFEGPPTRCLICHSTSHLWNDCTTPVLNDLLSKLTYKGKVPIPRGVMPLQLI